MVPHTPCRVHVLRRLVTVAAYDGDVYYTIIANSLVHAVMYFYYLLTCFNVRPTWVLVMRRVFDSCRLR